MEALVAIAVVLGAGAVAASAMSGTASVVQPERNDAEAARATQAAQAEAELTRYAAQAEAALANQAARDETAQARQEAERVKQAARAEAARSKQAPPPEAVPDVPDPDIPQAVIDLLRTVSLPIDRDWNDPNAFRNAVAEQRARLFPPGTYVLDKVIFEVCKNAFASFARKFGHFVFADTDESSAHYSKIQMTMSPVPKAPEEQTVGTNFGALAERYMYLRQQVDAPGVAHNDKGLNPNSVRYKRWKDGWEKGWGYKELSIVQRAKRNPLVPFTNNWPVFLHLSVQYSMMEMLFSVFWTMTRDFHRNPGSWNARGANVVAAVEQHVASIKGSGKIAQKQKSEATVIMAVVAIGKILSKAMKPLSLFGVIPAIMTRIGAIQKANGNVQIDKQLVDQLNAACKDAVDKEFAGGPTAGLLFVFDDIAAFAAALQVATEGGMPPPTYLVGGSDRHDIS
jgi:hypothetical protein